MGNKRVDADSVHHILPREVRDEGYNVDSPKNLISLPFKTIHEPIHRLFKNKTPQEQIEFWNDINKGVLSKIVKEMIRTLIRLERDEFYDNSLLK